MVSSRGIARLAPGLVAVVAIACLLYDRARTRAELQELNSKLNHMADASRPAQQHPRARTWAEIAAPNNDSLSFSAESLVEQPITGDDASAKSYKPEEASRRNQEYWEKQQQHLESIFAAEARDRGWASATEVTLSNKIQSLLPDGSTLQEARCASTFCRAQFSHLNRAAYREFLRKTFPPGDAVSPTEKVITSRPQADGSQKTTAFIAREGHALPTNRTIHP